MCWVQGGGRHVEVPWCKRDGEVRKKHQRTLESIFSNPVPTDLEWSEAVSLLEALGAEVTN